MKNFLYLFSLFFLISIILIYVDWQVDGYNFFKFEEQHFYFQSWISLAGVLFTIILAIQAFILSKKMKIDSLKYVSSALILTTISYLIIGYHASYCKTCSDLGYCAASHNYSVYLMVIAFIIFIVLAIMTSHKLDIIKRVQSLKSFSYSLVIASILLATVLFLSLRYLEFPDNISYVYTINLQAFVFILSVMIIVLAFVYFRQRYKASRIYLLLAILASLSFFPQFLHILTCQDCHTLECSEFYVLPGLIMMIIASLFIYAVNIQLEQQRKE